MDEDDFLWSIHKGDASLRIWTCAEKQAKVFKKDREFVRKEN